MKRKSLLFALLMALFMPWAAQAQEELTVCDGTTTNNYIPFYGSYVDTQGCTCEFIIPAETEGMSDMEGGTISKLTFYISNSPQTWGSPTIQVYMGEVDGTTLSGISGPTNFTTVYTGTISNQTNPLEIELTDAYTYGGGNLFIGTYVQTASSTYKSTSFYGVSAPSGSSIYHSGSSYGSATVQSFLPKTTFTYEPAQQGGDVCEKPTTCEASDVTSTSAILTWSGGSGTYNVEVKGGDWADWTEILHETNLTTTTLTLLPTTSYQARVQSVCDGSTPTSGWKTSSSFTTPCGAYDIPYTYGFEEAAPFGCWTVISGNITRYSGTTNTGSYRLDFRGTTSNMIALPQFNDATNTLRVEFWTRPESTGGSSGKFAIGYMTDITDASTFVAVETYNSTEMTQTYVKKTVDFANAPAGANIAMRQFDCSTNYYWYVDDVTVKEMPSCVAPTALDADNITTNSAELSWTANSNETAWTLYWKESSATDYTEVANATNPYTLSGLTAATNYEYYVVANCSTDDASEPSEVFTFVTECEVTTALGYTENFDDYEVASAYTAPSARVLPDCWSAINTTTYGTYKVFPTIYYYSSTNYANSTPNSLKFYSYAYYSSGTTTYDPQPQYAILPEMEGLAGMQVQLMARGYNATSTFKIGTMSDPTDASTFTMIAEQTLTTSYPEDPFEYNIPANCTDSYLAIMIDAANSSRTTNGVYIDDIVITTPPTCIKPTSLTVTAGSITTDGATITWTAGGDETNWQIEFATDADFTHPLYETVEGEPTYTFHGLDETTTYYVHVQAVCGGSDGSSEYSATVSFTTLQTPANLPYATDFESKNDWVFVNGSLTNAWAYGEATSNGQGTHALYISNDGGTNNTYSNDLYTMVYATKLFNFEAGTYVFSYDWKANGESTYDYLRVALVPSTVTLTAGTSAPTVPSGSFYNNLPTGWIALDGGSKLNLKSDWQSYASNEIEITAGTYMMVFAWRNDNSGGTTPPAAIDNVSIEKITCITPTGLDAPQSGITATSAELSWTENGEATAWQIELTDEEENVITIDVDEADLVNGVYTIASLTSETVYTAKVRANCGDGFSRWSEEVIFETAADCQMSDGLTATATSNSAEISWNGYGQETFNLRYSTDGETWTTVTNVANPYTLDQLTSATTYQVQVQPICADEGTWSEAYTFHTLCESITTFPWSEGFEDGALSFCWDQDGNGTWSVGTGDGNTSNPAGAHTGTYNAKITHGTSGNVTKLITPVLDLTSLNHPALTFWYINRNWGSDTDDFAVYYRTASDAEWTLIYATEETHTEWTRAAYLLPNPSATYQIAFEMTDDYGYGIGIDDVMVLEAVTKEIAAYGDSEKGGYYLIASPLADDVDPATVGMITDELGANVTPETSTYDLYQFDQTSIATEWQNYRAGTFDLVNGMGYLYASKEGTTLTFIGAPGTNGDVTLAKEEGNPFAGWNLVGNPFGKDAYINKPFYTLENSDTYTENTTDTPIHAMQGLLVVADEDGETLTFTTEAPGKSAKLNMNLLNGNKQLDNASLVFGGNQQLGKLSFRANSSKIYMPVEGKDYAIATAESNMGEMPVSFKAEKNGSYTLNFNAEEVSFAYLHLIDNMTGTDTDLLSTPSYSFDAKTTDYANRFKLVFATGNNGNDDTFAFFSNGSFVINNDGEATLQVVDVTGRIVKSESINGCANVNVNAAPGVYMIRLVNGDNVKVQKVVIK